MPSPQGVYERTAVSVGPTTAFTRALSRLAREQYGEDLSALARAVGVSESLLSRFLGGAISPSLDTLVRLALVLEVDVERLVLSPERAARRLEPTVARGMLSPADVTMIERHSVHTAIVTGDLSTDVRVSTREGSSAVGSPSTFTPVVTENVTAGSRYEYFVPQGPSWGHEAKLLRQVVVKMGGLTPAFVDRHLQVTHVRTARFPGFVVYQVPIERLQRGASGVFARVLPFLHPSAGDRATGFIATVEPANSTYPHFALVSRDNVPRIMEELHAIRSTSDQRARAMGAVVARVVEVWPHPRADQIHIAVIDVGDGQRHQVVFGGTRMLRPGELVPAAPPGTLLPGRPKMRQRRYRGKSSFGMLCSTDELGWTSGGPNEVAVLSLELVPGQSLDDIDPAVACEWISRRPQPRPL